MLPMVLIAAPLVICYGIFVKGVQMKNYGLPYQGSKSRIAKWIIEQLPPAKTLIDLFAGGGAITHCAALSGKYETIVMNDISGTPEMFESAVNGEFEGYSFVATREQFFDLKDDDKAVELFNSFGDKGTSYICSKQKEHFSVLANRLVLENSVAERKSIFVQLMKEIKRMGGVPAYADRIIRIVNKVERTQAIANIASCGCNIVYSQDDYRRVGVPEGSVVYADPPYRGTTQYGDIVFDFEGFDKWLSVVPFPVIISEYTAPDGCVEIAKKEVRRLMNSTDNTSKTTEKLFIQQRYEGWWAENTAQKQLF